MGYIRHHAIIVTISSYAGDLAAKTREKAIEIFGRSTVSAFQSSPANGYITFFVGPDGSKEGWGASDDGDEHRARFIDWMREQAYEDGSSPIQYAEVQYYDEAGDVRVLNSQSGDYKDFREREKEREKRKREDREGDETSVS